ncbi:unnamed protein product [Haemonchus placei]|uniref:Gag-Pol polyprotein n=1 Tax=Haemonchus placei TaxID=6290 RepID=A0A0N4WAE9_HAEPC|nr:unnamed protein product [Haemonchus placei]
MPFLLASPTDAYYMCTLKAMSIVNCYSSHSTANEVELDAFYDQLEEISQNEKPFYEFDVGHFNARIGEASE